MAKVPANRSQRRPKPAGLAPIRRRMTGGMTEVTIPSDFIRSRELQHRIMEDVAARHYGEQDTFAIRISLEEALVNAIRHGNRMDPSKQIHVRYRVTSRQAEFSIEDEGPGFDRHDVPDPTCDENLEKCSGRGILLMEAYMTSVRFDRGGRRLHLLLKKH